jgi:hypothetical protein
LLHQCQDYKWQCPCSILHKEDTDWIVVWVVCTLISILSNSFNYSYLFLLQSAQVNISFLVFPLTVILPYFGQGPLNDGQTLRTMDRFSDCTDYPYNGQTILCSKDNWIMKKHIYEYQLYLNGIAALYWSKSMSWIHNLVVATMATTVWLFRVPIWPIGHHLPLVRNSVKVTKKAHVWVEAVCPMV